MQTSRTFNDVKCKGTCTSCLKSGTGCLRESGDKKPERKKSFTAGLCLLVTILQLSGCGHSQWVAMRDKTHLASFMNPLGFAIHIGAAAGALFTEQDNNDKGEVLQAIEHREETDNAGTADVH